jgi:hypothetical protein
MLMVSLRMLRSTATCSLAVATAARAGGRL